MNFLLMVSFPDMWAMGAIMAELFTLRPLFPGSRYNCPQAMRLHSCILDLEVGKLRVWA